jgi:hypothetical protein
LNVANGLPQATGRVFESVDTLYGTLWAKSLKIVANKCS